MRFLLAILLFAALSARAEESADFASTAETPKSWNATHDMVSGDQPNHAKVRAFINGLLGEDHSSPPAQAEENSGQKQDTAQ